MRKNYTIKQVVYFLMLLLIVSSCRHVKKVPYTTVERVNEELTFSQERGEWNRVNGIPGFQHPKLKGNCYVTNTSAYDGTFKVHFVFNSQGEEVDFVTSEYARAGERKYFSVEGNINHFTFENNVSCTINVEPPVIQVDKEVTRYKEEEYYSLF